MVQLTHNESFFKQKTFPIILVCDHIAYQPNIGSIFRICEAFGVEKILFVGEGLVLTPRKINRTSRSTHLTVPYEVIEKPKDAVALLGAYEVVALEITSSSIPLQNIELTPNKPVALIAGSEIEGISSEFLNIAHQTAHIEMFGANSSMNVVQAIGIGLYELTAKMS